LAAGGGRRKAGMAAMEVIKEIKDVLFRPIPGERFDGMHPVLQEEHHIEQLVLIKRLPIYLLALDAETVKKDFVDDILKTLASELRKVPDKSTYMPLQDETAAELAQVLGKMDEIFKKYKIPLHSLFDLLVVLCSIDETTVRDEAVASLRKLAGLSPPQDVAQYLAAAVIKMADGSGEIRSEAEIKAFCPARVSSCHLLAPTYKILRGGTKMDNFRPPTVDVNGEAMDVPQMMGLMVQLFQNLLAGRDATATKGPGNSDQSPQTKRTAARNLSEAVDAFGEQLDLEGFLTAEYKEIIEREQEAIRVNALTCAGMVFTIVPFSSAAGSLYLDCLKDKSWRVRVAAVESLGQVAVSLKAKDPSTFASEYLPALQTCFLKLMDDPEEEVKNKTAARVAEVAHVLEPQWVQDKLMDMLIERVRDENAILRVDLAGTIMELAAPLGATRARKIFMGPNPKIDEESLLACLLADQNTNLRLMVIDKLAAFLIVLNESPDERASVDKIHGSVISELAGDKNWRVRWSAMKLYPDVAETVDMATMMTPDFSGNFLKMSVDNCAAARVDWVVTCGSIARVYANKGKRYLRNQSGSPVRTVLDDNVGAKAYQFRAVVLDAAKEWCDLMETADATEFFDQLPMMDYLADRVPNLRLHAVECVTTVCKKSPHLKEKILKDDKLVSHIAKLSTDTSEDSDVQSAATAFVNEFTS